jgi:tetratricopeptide (TPR) repeat protein
MIPALAVAVAISASAGAQDVVRAEAPNAAARPSALVPWEWPDCARVLSDTRESFAEAMCRAAASRTRFQSASDVLDAAAARHRVESIDQLRRAFSLASSTIEKRVALSELATTYSVVAADAPLAELAWRDIIALDPGNPAAYLALARAQERRGELKNEEITLAGARQALPQNVEIVEALARLYRIADRADDSIRAFREFADQDPQDASRRWRLATWYWQLQTLPRFQSRAAEFTAAGLKAIDRALALQPDDGDALTCKYTLLRRQAELATDPSAREAALAAASAVRAHILELKR